MTFRLSTLSTLKNNGVDYKTGDLSLFPNMIDDFDSLYTATNNATTISTQTLTYNGKSLIVSDTSTFPDSGLLRLGTAGVDANFELIYYANKNATTFYNLARGFAGSLTQTWPIKTSVSNSVQAEPHNATKDALLNIETYIGKSVDPDPNSINGLLTTLENQYLAPKPSFAAYPTSGLPALKVKFQNFSNSEAIRFLWDFGDGGSSSDRSPTYTYVNEGTYTVTLNMVTSTGAAGIATKTDYITVSNNNIIPFFYSKLITSDSIAHTASYEFVDQTNGVIAERYWVFGDGVNYVETDPYVHSVRHIYNAAGSYNPSLLIVFQNQLTKRVFLQNVIVVE